MSPREVWKSILQSTPSALLTAGVAGLGTKLISSTTEAQNKTAQDTRQSAYISTAQAIKNGTVQPGVNATYNDPQANPAQASLGAPQ